MKMYTAHAVERMNQRGISSSVIDLVIDWGRCFISHGREVYFIPKKMIRKLNAQGVLTVDPERLKGVYVVVGNGEIVTVAHKASKRFRA